MPRIPLPERRARLIAAAIAVIGERGVGAATTRAIASAADMPLASFHYAFESHDALMSEVMVAVLHHDATAMLELIPPDETDPARALQRVFDGFISSLAEDQRRQRTVQELTHYALRNPGMERLAVEQQEVARRIVARGFDQFAESSGVRFTVSGRQLADQLLLITDGLTMAYIVDHDEAALRALVPALAGSFAGYVARD